MLLYPVRWDVGLGYDFYYNHDPESVHCNIKARQNCKATEMSTVFENIHMEKNANLYYVEDAIIGNGPFELAPEFTHFNIDQSCWTYHWSEEKKKNHLCQFHEAVSTDPLHMGISKPRDKISKKMNCDLQEERKDNKKKVEKPPVPLGDTGLSSVFSSSYNKAARFLVNSANINNRWMLSFGSIIVSRGEWLGRPANFKGAGYCLAFEVETGYHVTYTVHHCSQYPKQDGGR